MSKVKIFSSLPKGTIILPSSKSDAHRKIIASSLCFGQTSLIEGVDFSDDINRTIEAMRNFANIEIKGHTLKITSFVPKEKKASFNAYESGSTLRFLIPVFSLFFDETTIEGQKRLLERPLSIYQELFQDKLIIEDKITLKGKLEQDEFIIKGDVSSQFISGLLFALPLRKKDSRIKIVGNFESKSYVNLTIGVLKEFKIEILEVNSNEYLIKGGQRYIAKNVKVEGDYSQLAFYGVLGVISSSVKVVNVNKNSLQGDKKVIDIIKSFNGKVEDIDEGYIFHKSDLVSSTIDLNDNPDLGPILFVLAVFSKGTTTFLNTKRLKIKESDRVLAMKKELKKFNVEIIDEENKVTIKGQEVVTPNQILYPSNDHRILMALSILGTKVKECEIEDIKCVNKSYPNFFKDLFSLGIEGEIYD